MTLDSSTVREPLASPLQAHAPGRDPAVAGAGTGARAVREALAFALLIGAVHLAVFAFCFAEGRPLRVLHYEDEFRYHAPQIEAFAERGLVGGFEGYTSNSTPLFYLGFAALESATGLGPWGLRAANVLLHVVASTLVFLFVRGRTRDRGDAWLLAAGFALAPYGFGRAHLLLAETTALLWLVLAFLRFDRWLASAARPDLWAAAGFLSLAVLTRQNLLWIAPWFAAVTLLREGAAPRARLADAAAWLLPVGVFLPFLLTWGGLVPPAFQAKDLARDPNLRACLFTVTALGLYAGLLAPSRLVAFARARPAPCAAAALLALGLCLAVGMRFQVQGIDDGYLWRIAQHTPSLLGTSVLLAGLTVLGAVELARATCAPGDGAAATRRTAYLLFVGLFAVSLLLAHKNFQKYYEAQLLLVLIWNVSAEDARPAWLDRLGRAAFVGAGLLYVLAKLPAG